MIEKLKEFRTQTTAAIPDNKFGVSDLDALNHYQMMLSFDLVRHIIWVSDIWQPK